MNSTLSENNFHIKLKKHYRLYVLLKDKIIFESEWYKILRWNKWIPSIDVRIRNFILDSDMENVNLAILMIWPISFGYHFHLSTFKLVNNLKPLVMRRLILISFLLMFFIDHIVAQENYTEKSINHFAEWNFGAAYIPDSDGVFPGTSILWGKTIINKNNFIIEYEAGFALPTLVTGKLGIGKRFNTTKVIIGIRPFPFNFFMQSSFTNSKKGYWILSIEFNPLNTDSILSFGSEAILNFGYRWHTKR